MIWTTFPLRVSSRHHSSIFMSISIYTWIDFLTPQTFPFQSKTYYFTAIFASLSWWHSIFSQIQTLNCDITCDLSFSPFLCGYLNICLLPLQSVLNIFPFFHSNWWPAFSTSRWPTSHLNNLNSSLKELLFSIYLNSLFLSYVFIFIHFTFSIFYL